MKIEQIMRSDVAVISASESVRDAAKKMATSPGRAVPVVDEGRVVGVLTDHDIVSKSVASGVPPNATTVRAVMNEDVIGISSGEEIEIAAALMKSKRVGTLLVAADDKLAGTVSLEDLVIHGKNPALMREVIQAVFGGLQ